jgi:hypothetical protein
VDEVEEMRDLKREVVDGEVVEETFFGDFDDTKFEACFPLPEEPLFRIIQQPPSLYLTHEFNFFCLKTNLENSRIY